MGQARISVFQGSGTPITQAEVPLPLGNLQDNQVLVQVETATICGSDIWTYTGARDANIPLTLGHEGVGHVVESKRRDLEPGTRVVWSIVDSCGRCPFCTDYDLPQKCDHVTKYGHNSGELNGTYASHMLLRAGTTVLPVSPTIQAPLASTLCCAWSTAEACIEHVRPESQRVLVVGLGMLGFSIAYLLKRNGKSVSVLDNREDKLRLAESMGYVTDLPREVDAVIESVGKIEPFEQALDHLRIGGTAVIAGLVHPDSHLTFPAERIVKSCWRWIGVHNYNPRHLHRALVSAFSFQEHVDPTQIFSPAFPLDKIEDAFAEAQTGRWLRVPIAPGLP